MISIWYGFSSNLEPKVYLNPRYFSGKSAFSRRDIGSADTYCGCGGHAVKVVLTCTTDVVDVIRAVDDDVPAVKRGELEDAIGILVRSERPSFTSFHTI